MSKISMFVKRSDSVEVKIYAFDDDGNIDIVLSKNDVPKDKEAEEVSFTFRRPAYSDSTMIIRESQIDPAEGTVNLTAFQSNILHSLLTDWSICDDDGEKVPVNRLNINNLQPSIARGAVAAAMEKIKIA